MTPERATKIVGQHWGKVRHRTRHLPMYVASEAVVAACEEEAAPLRAEIEALRKYAENKAGELTVVLAANDQQGDEIAKLRAEVEALKANHTVDWQATVEALEFRAEKAEAEVEALRTANDTFARESICRGDDDPLKCQNAPCDGCVNYLRADNARLREALQLIATGSHSEMWQTVTARAALAAPKEGT